MCNAQLCIPLALIYPLAVSCNVFLYEGQKISSKELQLAESKLSDCYDMADKAMFNFLHHEVSLRVVGRNV